MFLNVIHMLFRIRHLRSSNHKYLTALNILCLIPILLSQLAPYVPASSWNLPNVLALAMPWLLIPCLAGCLLWAWQRNRRLAYFNLLPLALAVPQINHSVQYSSIGSSNPSDIRVLSLNVGAFSYRHCRWQRIVDQIAQQQPDVVCLQEFCEIKSLSPSYYDRMKQTLGLPYHHYIRLSPHRSFGLLILSKFAITDAGIVTHQSDQNGIMYADLEIAGKTVRVYNVHLESYRTDNPALQMAFHDTMHPAAHKQQPTAGMYLPPKANGPSNKAAADLLSRNWIQTLRHITHTWQTHEAQVAQYQAHMAQWGDKPVIVCGDLNNVPYSYVYRQVSMHLKDSFIARGRGMGKTYGTGIMALRIDYLFASRHIRIKEHNTLHSDLTDHKGVLVRMHIP
jgi:endonuclease/exonuclease/phosphatase family metal-dependent hydrolase